MQNNLTQDCITGSPFELHNLLENKKLEKGAVEMLSPDLFAVPYKSHSDFVESHNKYNVVIALYTTSYARTILYYYMEKIINAPNHKLLYTGGWPFKNQKINRHFRYRFCNISCTTKSSSSLRGRITFR